MTKHSLISILTLSLAFSPTALGQDSATELNTVTVLGNKENKSYEESTESISVVPSRELDTPVLVNSVQALNALPNITVNRPDNSFSIRGINNTGVTGYAKDNVSSILVDDVFQTDLAVKAGSIDLWDIHHVEVYRGPQSTSQGVNSLAGSILLFHNKAVDQTEGAVKLGYGSFNRQEMGLVTNNTWLGGQLSSRLSYNRETSDGFIKNVTRNDDKWGGTRKDHLGLDLIFKLNESDFIRINSKLMQTDNGGTYVESANPFDYEVYEDAGFNSLTGNNQTSIRFFKKINDRWNNEVIAAYSASRNDEYSDADFSPTNSAGVRYETHIDSFYSVENLLKYQSGPVKNVLGLHAHQYSLMDDDQFNLLFPLPSPPAPPNTIAPIATRQKTDKYRSVLAVFDSVHYKFTDSQSVNLGLRYEYVKNEYDASVSAVRTQNYGGAANAVVDAYLAQRSGSYGATNYNSVFLPKAAYTFEVGAHTYGASIAQGYRTGGVSINRSQARADQYDPETTTNYELSYKFNQESVRISANAFYTDWNEQQVLVASPTDSFDSQVMNAASSRLYGAELETQWELGTRHRLGLSGGYVYTQFDNFVNGGNDYSGNQFPYSPNWTGRAFYTHSFTDAWSATSLFRYVGESYTDVQNTRRAPDQFYVDLSSQYLWSQYSLMADFYVRNLTGAQYVLDARTTYQVNIQRVNTPQELGARLTYMW